jgi:cell division septum initiation protein DivIVA
MDRTLELGYFKGTLILITLLATALAFWKVRFGSISINRVHGFELELMYWTTILCSNTLGTALGDYLSDSSGLGFGGGALLIAGLIAVVAVLHFRTGINKMVLFWAAFVLTRPLGATVGDLFTKPPSKGGLGFGTYGSTAVLVAVLVGLIIKTNRNGAPALAVGGDLAGDRGDDSPVPERRTRTSTARDRRPAPQRSGTRRRTGGRLRAGPAPAWHDGSSPGRSTRAEACGSMAQSPELRAASLQAEDITGQQFTIERDGYAAEDVDAILNLAAESAGRIQAEAEAMAERIRREAAAFAEAQQAFACRMVDAQRIRQEAEADRERSRRRAEAEAAELRARAERESLEIIECAQARAAERTAQAERQIRELQVAETEMVDRLQQAQVLWETVLETLRPQVGARRPTPSSLPALRNGSSFADEPLIDLEPSVTVAEVSPGYGNH